MKNILITGANGQLGNEMRVLSLAELKNTIDEELDFYELFSTSPMVWISFTDPHFLSGRIIFCWQNFIYFV